MDHETVDVYELRAAQWQVQRAPARTDAATAFGLRVADGPTRHLPVVDLGCGPGWHTAALAPSRDGPVVALDAARSMLDLVPEYAPDARRIQADLARLPFGRQALGGAWASKSYVHLRRADVPLALHDLHRSLAVGSPFAAELFGGDAEHRSFASDDFPGRRYSLWPPDLLQDVLVGAGFTVESPLVPPAGLAKATTERATGPAQAATGQATGAAAAQGGDPARLVVRATRARTLADTVGPDMRVLVCGLNPSLHAADAGLGFSRPGNRFWPAALAAGLVSVDRDPLHALGHHGLGMTDLVKRASPRADGLTVAEYTAGLARIDRLVAWLQPRVVCFVGLAGWRAATDRRAQAGEQDRVIGGRPVYVMPNTSGVNASSSLADLTGHLQAVAALASR